MESIECKRCGKIMEGYTQRHVDTLLAQHQIKHQNEANEKLKHNIRRQRVR